VFPHPRKNNLVHPKGVEKSRDYRIQPKHSSLPIGHIRRLVYKLQPHQRERVEVPPNNTAEEEQKCKDIPRVKKNLALGQLTVIEN